MNGERYTTRGNDAFFYWLAICGSLMRNRIGIKKSLDYQPIDREADILRNIAGQARFPATCRIAHEVTMSEDRYSPTTFRTVRNPTRPPVSGSLLVRLADRQPRGDS